jgi:hypothetical protein
MLNRQGQPRRPTQATAAPQVPAAVPAATPATRQGARASAAAHPDPGTPAAAAALAPPSDLLTPDAAAGRLGITKMVLERWRGTGNGPAFVRLSRKTLRYRAADIERFIAERACASTAAG